MVLEYKDTGSADNVPLNDIEESIKEFSALGIEVMFTELDLSVLPNPWDKTTADVSATAKGNAKMNPYTNGIARFCCTNAGESLCRFI